MIYVFDIDGTICTNTNGDYEKAEPFTKMVEAVNDLYEKGHTIKMMTARGSITGIDWTETTIKQLDKWNLKYHELIMNKKPHADVYVDDKAINAEAFKLLLG